LDEIKNNEPVQVMELDEMHSYIGHKKIIAGYGLLLIDMGKDSSTAYLVPGELSLEKSSGTIIEDVATTHVMTDLLETL
jgi:hypothetical protein